MNSTTIERSPQVDIEALLDRITKEHGVSGKRALNYTAPRIPKVAHYASSPRPRFDRTTVDTLSRLYNVIDGSAAKSAANGGKDYARHIGKTHGRFYLATTDGTRALFLPDDGQARAAAAQDLLKLENPQVLTIHNPEMFCAVKRAMVMTDSRRHHRVDLLLSQDLDGLRVMSEDADVGTFDETVQEPSPSVFTAQYPTLADIFKDALTTVVSINGSYLLDVLGSWPLTMYYAVGSSHVVFAPADGSFRYVVALLDSVKKGGRDV